MTASSRAPALRRWPSRSGRSDRARAIVSRRASIDRIDESVRELALDRCAVAGKAGRMSTITIQPVGRLALHIYGTDLTRVGSSVRRYYNLPAEPIGGHS